MTTRHAQRIIKLREPDFHGPAGRMPVTATPKFTPLRILLLVASLTLLALGSVGPALAQERHVLVAEVDGMINSVTQRFISRVVDRGEKDEAEVVIIRLDTPGGLLDSTLKITEDLLSDRVPTVVYVHPSGAGAFSAGTFITAAATFAVMAPATSIGAASPVSSGGEDLPETLESKVVNATAAEMRSIAQRRGRNSGALEDTVRRAIAYDAQQAVKLNVVDFIANDVPDLLRQLDGRTVQTASGPQTLDTQGLPVRNMSMSLVEKFLFFLADPNISFLMLSLGGLGLVIELFSPGLMFPGVVGAILLLLAFVSLGNLPVNWAAAGFILLAGVLVVAEVFVAGFGVLGIGAIVAFIFGGLLLFESFGSPSPTSASVGVNPYLLGSISGALTLFGTWLARTMIRSRKEARGKLRSVDSSIVGTTGEATTDLDPRGTVHVANEVWTAMSEGDIVIETGSRVRVVAVEGIVLTVALADEDSAQG